MTAGRLDLPAGGGAFAISRLAVGLFLVDQDRHRIAVGSDRKQFVPLRAGDGWILPAGSSGTCEYDDALSFLRVDLSDALLDDVGFEKADFNPVVGSLDPLLVQFVRHAASLRDVPQSLYRDTMNLAVAAHLTQLLLPAPLSSVGIEDRRLRRALAYIHDNLADDLSLDDIASEAAMSRFHFVRAFTAALGTSPLQYVIRERMERAKVLLKTTRVPIAAVAIRVGYDDVSRFGQHFRRNTGITPAAFRRR
ncbi:helix-turn-helix domain-containing protein [Rhizobium leguminosarum]|uniref:helix-turn-helix domain-containing protein n=1 Tax=Rhizobium leguminosarum TaxID=384 RepID=UPI001C9395C6|nr:AraC family transcriptional regulator [Rhizobium leguminosarum]MBY5564595.1 helix-turn-helix transcriptional regulator [Rhizobium leguminosarum]MBY5624365.1 helix-turn-helix transcriptional regulator [Rhizobium leguminosarum]